MLAKQVFSCASHRFQSPGFLQLKCLAKSYLTAKVNPRDMHHRPECVTAICVIPSAPPPKLPFAFLMVTGWTCKPCDDILRYVPNLKCQKMDAARDALHRQASRTVVRRIKRKYWYNTIAVVGEFLCKLVDSSFSITKSSS